MYENKVFNILPQKNVREENGGIIYFHFSRFHLVIIYFHQFIYYIRLLFTYFQEFGYVLNMQIIYTLIEMSSFIVIRFLFNDRT